MEVSLIILASLFVVGLLLYLHHRLTQNGNPEPEPEKAYEQPQEGEACCGMHMTCEKDSLSTVIGDKIVYYDDEELDSYQGRAADDYADNEIEQFRDVLLTLIPEDIAGWARSLQLRNINLPLPVRDELLMIVAEQRAIRAKKEANV